MKSSGGYLKLDYALRSSYHFIIYIKCIGWLVLFLYLKIVITMAMNGDGTSVALL